MEQSPLAPAAPSAFPPGLHITYVALGRANPGTAFPGGPDGARAVPQGAPAVHVVGDPRSGLGRIRHVALGAGLLDRTRPRAFLCGATPRPPSTATRRGGPDEPDAGAVAGLCSRGFAGGPQSRGPGAATGAVLRVRAGAPCVPRREAPTGAALGHGSGAPRDDRPHESAGAPRLAAYMGHVSIVSTAYYLQSSNPSRPPPARDSPTTAATSSPDPPDLPLVGQQGAGFPV